MKKAIIFVVMIGFMAAVASVAFGRTLAEEKKAIQDYLKVLDVKIIKARKNGQFAKTTMLKSQKTTMLARWAKVKASLEAPAAPAPAPAPVVAPVPVPAPAPVVVKSNGTFGLGLNTEFKGLYINTGKGAIQGSGGLMGNLVLDDFIGLGPLFGLSADNVKFKLGLAGYDGSGLKAIPVYAGGTIHLPQLLGGQDAYLTGGLNYVVYGNGKTSGKIGGDIYLGFTADFGIGIGKTGFEIGWSVVRSNTVTSKGISLAVSQPLAL